LLCRLAVLNQLSVLVYIVPEHTESNSVDFRLGDAAEARERLQELALLPLLVFDYTT
jgi:hypothetical protein